MNRVDIKTGMYGKCVVVDTENNPLRIDDAVKIHQGHATLHRAFSIFLFGTDGRLLMQQRSKHKKTFPLAFTNTVCSHQRNVDESDEYFCRQRLLDEVGIDVAEDQFQYIMSIEYRSMANLEFSENEIDRIFVAVVDIKLDTVVPNALEVNTIVYMDDAEIANLLQDNCCFVSPWFRSIWTQLKSSRPDIPLYDLLVNQGTTYTRENEIIHRHGKVDMPDATVQSDHILYLPFSYVSSIKGKDIRGKLVRLFGSILGCPTQHTDQVAQTVNKIHQASLVLDDIEDGSNVRRGLPAGHIQYGIPFSINAGVAALIEVIETAHHRDPDNTAHVVHTIMELHRGQGAEIYWTQFKAIPTIPQLERIMHGKTGALFELGYTVLASSATSTHDDTLKELLFEWIHHFGLYFQINDDYINLTSPAYWKLKGFCDDFDEQKYSFPVVLFLNDTTVELKDEFETVFYKHDKTDADKHFLLGMLKEAGIFETVQQHLDVHIEALTGIVARLHALIPDHYHQLEQITKAIIM